jgi:hypothetical protein
MPGVIKNDEITNQPSALSSLERSRTERRRKNNSADDPAKQLFDERIPIQKKVHISRPLYLPVASKTDSFSLWSHRALCVSFFCRVLSLPQANLCTLKEVEPLVHVFFPAYE